MSNGTFEHLELLHPRSMTQFSRYLLSLVEGRLWAKVLLGLGARPVLPFA